jgi:hypothetical protein
MTPAFFTIAFFENLENSLKELTQQLQNPDLTMPDRIKIIKKIQEISTKLLLQAGQYLEEVQKQTKRRFNKVLAEGGILRKEADTLIKASSVAAQLLPETSTEIGINNLLELSKPANWRALKEIKSIPDVTQLEVPIIIKNCKPSKTKTKSKAPIKWEKDTFGFRELVARIQDGDIARSFEQMYKESGLPLTLFVGKLLKNSAQDQTSVIDPDLTVKRSPKSELKVWSSAIYTGDEQQKWIGEKVVIREILLENLVKVGVFGRNVTFVCNLSDLEMSTS